MVSLWDELSKPFTLTDEEIEWLDYHYSLRRFEQAGYEDWLDYLNQVNADLLPKEDA